MTSRRTLGPLHVTRDRGGESGGIWGATSENDRKQLRKKRHAA